MLRHKGRPRKSHGPNGVERKEFAAPIVVCKGVDHLAMKIKAEARKNDVPTIENRPLARALYAAAKVGEQAKVDSLPQPLNTEVRRLRLQFRELLP